MLFAIEKGFSKTLQSNTNFPLHGFAHFKELENAGLNLY